MAVITGVGIAVLDIVNRVPAYPAEDSELRATGQTLAVGGNAANTLGVLARCGHQARLAGVTSDDPDGRFIRQRLEQAGISTAGCHRVAGRAPTSYILLSEETGSRSIVHYRDLPEYQFEWFRELVFDDVDWVHFEGRSVQETRAMLDWLARHHPAIRCSLEVEKPRHGIETLFAGPELILFSRQYARSQGFDNGADFLRAVGPRYTGTTLSCAWGESGAWGRAPGGEIFHEAPHSPARVIDTLGAGDVFNAAMIHATLERADLATMLARACRTGRKKMWPGRSGKARLRHVG